MQNKSGAIEFFTKKEYRMSIIVMIEPTTLEPLHDFTMEFERTMFEPRNCGGSIQESEVISQLLAAMPDSYQGVTTALDVLFCQGSTVTLDFVKSKLLSEEARQMKNQETEPGTAQAFAGFRSKWKKYNQGGNYSGNRGVGGNPSESSGNNGKRFPFKCYYCGTKGHKKSECAKRKVDPNRGNCNLTEDENVCFITSMEALSSSELKSDNQVTFIVDSGATNHSVNESVGKYLTEVKEVPHYKVNVAKVGENIIGKRQGNLHLQGESGKSILKNTEKRPESVI